VITRSHDTGPDGAHPSPFGQGRHELCPGSIAKNPGAHGVHAAEPAKLNVPIPQVVGAVAPVPHHVPGGQTRHVLEAFAPMMLLYVPATHAMHADDEAAPVMPLYVPATHGVHAAAPVKVLNVPAGQGVALVAPPAQNVPAGQMIPDADPLGQKEPVGQLIGVTVDPGQYLPAGQVMLVAGLGQ
jgi:hypothetical protein